jgi:hypothetical protein
MFTKLKKLMIHIFQQGDSEKKMSMKAVLVEAK